MGMRGTMNLAIMFLTGLAAGAEAVSEVERARTFTKTGKVNEAREIFVSMYKQYPTDTNLQINYAKFLYSCGEYEDLVRDFKDSTDQIIRDITERAAVNIKKAKSGSIEDLEALLRESRYSQKVLMALIKKCFQKKMFAKAKGYAESLMTYYGSDSDVKKMCAHANMLTSMYPKGIEMLKEIGLHKDVKMLEDFAEKYRRIKSAGRNLFGDLGELLSEIDVAELEESGYTPSVYTYLKYNQVLYDYVKLGVETRSKRLTRRAHELYKNLETDETGYLYIMALIADGDEKAQKAYDEMGVKDRGFRQVIERELQTSRERKQREDDQGSRRRQKNTQRDERNNASDHLGYYKLLGVGTAATTKEIRKAFLKKTKENDYSDYREKDPAEYKKREEVQKKLNKAHDVLKNTENRKKYDAESTERGGANYDANGFDDFFKVFFGNTNFGGGNSQQSQGQRTYYYYYT